MTTNELNKFLKFQYLIDFGVYGWDQDFVNDLELDVDEFIYFEDPDSIYENVVTELKSNLFTANKASSELIFATYFTEITKTLLYIKRSRYNIKTYLKRDFNFSEEFIHNIFDNFLCVLYEELSNLKLSIHKILETLDFESVEVVMENNDLLSLFFRDSNPVENTSSYPFINYKALDFFNTLHSVFKNNNNIHSDYSFIFSKMKLDNLIQENVNHEHFISFLNSDNYRIEINDRFKNLIYSETFYKKQIYNTIKRKYFEE